MKYLALIAFLSSTAFAQSITGVAVLKGSLKTKVDVAGISTECKVKVSRVRNIVEDDSYGFPGYKLRVEVSLDGKNSKRESVVKFGKNFEMTNFWKIDEKVVAKDFEYFSEDGALLNIKPDGRLKSFVVPYNGQNVTCSF